MDEQQRPRPEPTPEAGGTATPDNGEPIPA